MIRIGTRGSELALWQARHVASLLRAAGHEAELVVLETRGDRIDDVPLQSVEGKGFFTKELEQALLERRIDLAVHSHKDLPSEQPAGLVIAAVPPRASAEERLLVAPAAHDPHGLFLPLARGARVGTSAPRRTAQLAALRGDLRLLPLRGNVPTRVRKLRAGEYEAIVLAAAGLERLGLDLSGLVAERLPCELLVPAPGQGALAVQTRVDDAELRALCARVLADASAAETVAAERDLLTALGGGCNLPLGVALREHAGAWQATAFLGAGHPRSEAPARWCRASGASPGAAARAAGTQLLAGHATGWGPLAGLRIALTGSRGAAATLAERVAALGAFVVHENVLAVEDLDGAELPARLASLRAGDAVCLTSANAARRLAGLAPPQGVRLAAVGTSTARALAGAGLAADLVGNGGGRELAATLALARGARVLYPCAEHTHGELEQELARGGIEVERLVLYRTRAELGAALQGEVDCRLYLSPSAVAAALAWERAHAPAARRVALGAATSAALAAAGLPHRPAASTAPDDVLAALVGLETPNPTNPPRP